jgi:hypothetical protein
MTRDHQVNLRTTGPRDNGCISDVSLNLLSLERLRLRAIRNHQRICHMNFSCFVPALALVSVTYGTAFGQADTVRWERNAEHSDQFYHEGRLFKVVQRGDVIVAVGFRDTGWKLRADVYVVNRSLDRFDVVPEQFTLQAVSPRVVQILYRSPEVLARSISRRAALASGLIAAGAQLQQTSSAANTQSTLNVYDAAGRPLGTIQSTSTTTATAPDVFSRWLAQQNGTLVRQSADEAAAELMAISLRATTLFAGNAVIGAVYFERDTRGQEYMLRLPIGNIVFEVPWSVAPRH